MQTLYNSSPQVVEFIFWLFEPELALRLVLTNRIWQKWYCTHFKCTSPEPCSFYSVLLKCSCHGNKPELSSGGAQWGRSQIPWPIVPANNQTVRPFWTKLLWTGLSFETKHHKWAQLALQLYLICQAIEWRAKKLFLRHQILALFIMEQ